MKFWWLTESRRLANEKATVEELAQNESWFELDRWLFHEARLSAEGVLIAHGQRYPVRLVYPDQFPEVPAWIEPQDDVRWSTHQYGTRTLCLELRPDNWTPSATGADVLRSAHNLLITENPLGEGGDRAPSAHHIGQLQAYDWGLNPVLIGAGCLSRIRAGTAVDVTALRWMVTDDVWPIMVHDSVDRLSPRRPPGADISSWRFEIPVFLSTNSSLLEFSDRSALVCAGAFGPEIAEAIVSSTSGIVFFSGGEELAAFHLMNADGINRRRVFMLPEEGGARSARSPSASEKRVAVVGTGSVGSKVAECLIRSGVNRLTLVDGDVLLPGNLERHVLDWGDVGFRKVRGLKRRLLRIVPGADIDVVDVNLNWQRSSQTHAWQVSSIANCDVVVDATGDPATALFLAAVAEANGRAFVSIEVFEGGLGGLVAICLPDRDPPFATGRRNFIAWCDAQGAKPPEAGPRQYEMLAEDGLPVIADDAAVTATAGHASRIILDILDGSPPPIEAAWLLLGYRKGWVFNGHGHTIRLNVGERDQLPTVEVDAEAKAFALNLFREWLGENQTGVRAGSET